MDGRISSQISAVYIKIRTSYIGRMKKSPSRRGFLGKRGGRRENRAVRPGRRRVHI